VTKNELNQGFALDQMIEVNATAFLNAISDTWTALLIAANFPNPLVVGAAVNFGRDDLPPLWSAARGYSRKNLVLDGHPLAYLLPRDQQQFRLGEAGAY
jgi:hypothetical protein